MTWLLEVAGWFAGLLELVGLTAPLNIASFAGLVWFQVAAGFPFHFIFFSGGGSISRADQFSLNCIFSPCLLPQEGGYCS